MQAKGNIPLVHGLRPASGAPVSLTQMVIDLRVFRRLFGRMFQQGRATSQITQFHLHPAQTIADGRVLRVQICRLAQQSRRLGQISFRSTME